MSGVRQRNVFRLDRLKADIAGDVVVGRPSGIEIVRRAYELWEQAGKPDGQDQHFYHQAERELTEAAAPDAGSPIPKDE